MLLRYRSAIGLGALWPWELESWKALKCRESRLTTKSKIEMSTLIVRPKDCEPSTVKFDKMKMSIGRSSRNGICISDPFASRFHAEFKREGDQVLLVDAGSANGTFVNGKRVTAPVPLWPGDLIRIGETEIEYTSEEQDTLSLPSI